MAAIAVLLLATTASAAHMTVDVNTTSGAYDVLVDGVPWFASAPTRARFALGSGAGCAAARERFALGSGDGCAAAAAALQFRVTLKERK